MTRNVLASLVLLLLIPFHTRASDCGALPQTLAQVFDDCKDSSLPKEVQADLLRNQIVADVKANELQDALKAIDSYKKLQVSFPTPLWLVEAKAAYATGDKIRAKTALEAFLSHVDRNSTGYQEALALYPAYQQAAAPLIAQAAEQKEAARRQAAAKATAAAAKAAAEQERAEAERQATIRRVLAQPLDCTSKIKYVTDDGFAPTTDLTHAKGSPLGFLDVEYQLDHHDANKSSTVTFPWKVTSDGPGLPRPIRFELILRSDAFDGSLAGTKLLSRSPLVNDRTLRIEGGETWSGTLSQITTNPPLGKYCVVALLEEYYSGDCAKNDAYCVVDWVAFRDPAIFQ